MPSILNTLRAVAAALLLLGVSGSPYFPLAHGQDFSQPLRDKWWTGGKAFDVHAHIWPKVEPVLVDLVRVVQNRTESVRASIYGEKSINRPFSANVAFEKRILGLFLDRALNVELRCGASLAALPDMSIFECTSNIVLVDGGATKTVAWGPRARIEVWQDEEVMRADLDQWISATIGFVRDETDTVVRELE